jgi:heterotetrameric sarcosine oxidase gamma subunit
VTGFGKIRVTLWQRDGERFSLLVGRSFARSFWDWAEDVAREWAR